MKYLIANWKMNPSTPGDARRLLDEMIEGLKDADLSDKKVVICPPFPFLRELKTENRKLKTIFSGAQNCGYEAKGAFTGEVSPAMLKDLGVEYVILGHSERRRLFNEDDEMVANKVKAALEAGLTPILCVGSLTQETDDAERQTIKKQLNAVFEDFPSTLNAKRCTLLVAYEPVWAIGTGKAATPEQAKDVIDFIRDFTKNSKLKTQNYFLYGGSVNASNIASFTSVPGIEGALVGGASLNGKEFAELVKNA